MAKRKAPTKRDIRNWEVEDITGMKQPADYIEARDVKDGSWILVKCTIPVSEDIRPVTYGIYWATQAIDAYERQKIKIYTPSEVCLLNYEYIVLNEEQLQQFKDAGYYLYEVDAHETPDPLTLKMLEKGRSLSEEEREIIWALMLDGLSEQSACEEYFLTHHNDMSNIGYCYLPNDKALAELVYWFGTDGVAG